MAYSACRCDVKDEVHRILPPALARWLQHVGICLQHPVRLYTLGVDIIDMTTAQVKRQL